MKTLITTILLALTVSVSADEYNYTPDYSNNYTPDYTPDYSLPDTTNEPKLDSDYGYEGYQGYSTDGYANPCDQANQYSESCR